MKMFLGNREIVGTGSFKMTNIPWYLRWWYKIKLWRVRR